MGYTPRKPAGFINNISDEGTKEEAIEWLQKTWDEKCKIESQLATANANHEAVIKEWKAAMREIERLQAEIERMRPVLEARHKLHRKGPDCYSIGDGQGCPACALISEYEKSKSNLPTKE